MVDVICNVQASRRSCDITLFDFSCFSGQNSAHIFEEFGVHLLFLKNKKAKSRTFYMATFLPIKTDGQHFFS